MRQLAGGIAGSAAIVSLIGWLHIIMDWELVLGFYQAQDVNNPEGFILASLTRIPVQFRLAWLRVSV